MKDQVKRRLIVIIVIGILLWQFYIIQEEFAKYGMYQLISYRTHEMASIIPLLCTLVSIGCAIYLLVRLVKNISDTKEIVLLVIFILCLVMQFGYLKNQSNIVTTIAAGTVEEVNEQDGTIVVSIDGRKDMVILDCPTLLQGVLIEQEEKYLFSFESYKNSPDIGELHMISIVD